MNETAEMIHTRDTNDQPLTLPRLVKFSDGQTAPTDEVLSFASSNCTTCYGRGTISIATARDGKAQTEICTCASRRYLKSKQVLARATEPPTITAKTEGSEKRRQSEELRIERLSREVAKLEDELASRERHFNEKQASVRQIAISAEKEKDQSEVLTRIVDSDIRKTQADIEKYESVLQGFRKHLQDLLSQRKELAGRDAQIESVIGEAQSKVEIALNRFTKDNAGLVKDIDRARRRLATAKAYGES